ncbi:MAG: acyl-CoA dehydrogenase family protein [Pseudomonadota bacterium]
MSYMTEEREMIRDTAADFANEVVMPIANELDPVKGKIPRSLIEQMGELGFFGIRVSEEHGGSGMGCFEYCLIAEELSRAWMSVGSIIARSAIGGLLELPAEHRDRLIPRAVSGEFLTSFALSEPDVGSDLSGIKCRAEQDGDYYVLSGSKYWVTFADESDAIMVFARTTPREENPDKPYLGISGFLIEKPRGELPEGCSGSPIPKIGYYGWNTYELAFDGTRVHKDFLVGPEGGAFKTLTSGLELPRAHTAARSIGCAQGAFEVALQYAQDRSQFGSPIAKFQDIRFKLAKMATEIEAARQLLYAVCDKIDQGGRCDKEAAMVKYYAAEMSEKVTSDALQILGGAGYTHHFSVERCWRDARLTKIFEGTSEIQLRIISDQLLGR